MRLSSHATWNYAWTSRFAHTAELHFNPPITAAANSLNYKILRALHVRHSTILELVMLLSVELSLRAYNNLPFHSRTNPGVQ